ncbi:MAG: Cys-tRNA(Pro) deacylase [Acidobacteriota bacterium]
MAKSTATRALQLLVREGVAHEVHEYELEVGADDTTYGEQVAAALGREPERLYKTLVADLQTGKGRESVVAIVPVSGLLDLKALAKAAGAKKAEMADPSAAERLTGYVTGGISPFGQLRPLRIFADETLELWETICVSAGRRGLQVELEPAELLRLCEATIADLSR